MSAQLSLLTDAPPEIPAHINWSEGNSRRLLYDLFVSRAGQWIPLLDIVPITKTKHTQRVSDIRRNVLAGTEWVIECRSMWSEDPKDNPVRKSWYRLRRAT